MLIKEAAICFDSKESGSGVDVYRVVLTTLFQKGQTRVDDNTPLGHSLPEQTSKLLNACMISSMDSAREQAEVLVFVPSKPGHLIRSDILEIRLTDCPVIEGFVGFSSPTQTFSGDLPPLDDLEDLLAASAGACHVVPGCTPETLRAELSNRLSLNLMGSGALRPRTLAILECGKSPATGLGIFTAVRALNINVVALDKPGHWMSRPEHAQWRDAFIPIDRTPDEGLVDRIMAAVEGYGRPIDGIISFFDPLLPATAAAAARLGLPTGPVAAFEVAADKQKTSVLDGRPAYRISSLQEALAAVRRENSPLAYPLIVKPCSGWGSEGVFRVDGEPDLVRAIGSIDFERHGASFVLERYCDGPEVDANFVLCDGELLFFEASDDFPKDADRAADHGGSLQTFIEVANVLPSALPENELDILKNSLHQVLLRLGFTSGFFHLEARVHESAVEYGNGQGNRCLDLQPKPEQDQAGRSPSAWLIEINARPPGLQASWASRATYGVDFWGLALSFALGDKAGARALSVPFASQNQYWCQIVFIPVPKGGVFVSGDICEELAQRRPDLAANISRCLCFFENGDTVPEPSSGILTWVAYYLVTSRKSRQDLLEVADQVRRETLFEIA